MKRIRKIGMDVHTINYTLCAMEPVIKCRRLGGAEMRSSDDKRINFASFMLVGIIAFICSVIVCLFALAYVNLENIYFVLFISSLPIISVVIFLIGAIGTDIENKKEEGKFDKINTFSKGNMMHMTC